MDKQNTIDVDRIIKRLTTGKDAKDTQFTENQIKGIVSSCRKIFMDQPMLLELSAPIKIVGDIHGQFGDLLRIFDRCGFPPEANYLFLGDYVDRGQNSLETIMLLMAYKIKYPENFFLLRGNHQAAQINKLYGFYEQCKRKQSVKVWKLFTDCFNTMPVAALIEQKIVCMHGGISPELKKIKKINSLNRPTQVPSSGLLCDILWSDPEEVKGFQQNTERGIGYLFGCDVLTTFLKQNDLDLVCRSHQITEEGYQFFGKRQLVTVFSATNYCSIFQNWGAIMSVNSDLICSFEVIKPQLKGTGVDKEAKKRPKTPKFIN